MEPIRTTGAVEFITSSASTVTTKLIVGWEQRAIAPGISEEAQCPTRKISSWTATGRFVHQAGKRLHRIH